MDGHHRHLRGPGGELSISSASLAELHFGVLVARTEVVMDLLIAATAVAHEARRYARNPDDLRGLEGMLQIVALPDEA